MVLETLWVPVGTGAVRPIWKKFSAAGAAQRLSRVHSSVNIERGQHTIMSAKPKPAKTSGSSTGLYKADSVKVCKLFSSQDSFRPLPRMLQNPLGSLTFPTPSHPPWPVT
jgi:hypothetical protein